MIVEESGTRSKYIVALEFVPEFINCATVLVVLVALALVVVLVLILGFFLCFYVADAPPLPDWSSSASIVSI